MQQREVTRVRRAEAVRTALRSMIPAASRVVVVEKGDAVALDIVRVGVGPLLTDYGLFYEFVFRISDLWADYTVIGRSAALDDDFQPVFDDSSEILLRVDSGCGTGQVFHERTCDCAEQLDLALSLIAANASGLVVHIPRQDGRGLGLGFKLATLALQAELGVDTVDASSLLDPEGITRDARTYGGVVGILRFFGMSTDAPIRLLSNNPRKLAVFGENGFTNVGLRGIAIPPTEHTRKHLLAKQRHLGHIGLVPDPRPDRSLIGSPRRNHAEATHG